MKTIAEHYKYNSEHPSDINEHLPVLRELALQCDHITEMGVRSVVSTWAFLMARPQKLVSYDIAKWGENVDVALRIAKQEGVDMEFHEADVLKIEIAPTDFLFIDTLHTYQQLKAELKLHGNKARKFMAFHDTVTFGYKDEQPQYSAIEGLNPALDEFLVANPHWSIKKKYTNNNGLTVLQRDIR